MGEQSVCAMAGSHGCQHPASSLEGSAVTLQASNVNSWSIDRVSEWLGSVGLDHLAEDFKAHRITGDVLLELSLDDLAEIGVHALGDRKRLLRAVVQLRGPQACTPPRQDLFLQQPCSSPFVQQHGPQTPCSPPFLQQCVPQDCPPPCPPMAPPSCLPACAQYCSPPPPQAPRLAPAAGSA